MSRLVVLLAVLLAGATCVLYPVNSLEFVSGIVTSVLWVALAYYFKEGED